MSTAMKLRKKYTGRIAYPTLLLSVLALGVYSLSIVLAISGYISLVLSAVLNSIMAYLLFTSMHEAGHSNISGGKSNRWIDEVVGWLSGLSLFAPFYLFKQVHFRHHTYTNDPEKDPDHWLASKNFVSLVFHSLTILPLYFYSGVKILVTEKGLAKKARNELLISYFVTTLMFLALGGMIYFFGWKLPVILWVVPSLISQAFLAFAFDWLPHHPHENIERYLNTRVIDIPGISLLLISQNYHLIHHLHPSIPFYHYKNAYDELETVIKEKGVRVIKL